MHLRMLVEAYISRSANQHKSDAIFYDSISSFSIDTSETSIAFTKHFEREVSRYDHVSCISLVEQTGKEKVIADAYLNHIFMLDSADLSFVTFDFHEYW